MKVVIAQGESVEVEIADSDGRLTISYTATELTVSADMPGSHLGSEGLIYREVFAGCTCEDMVIDEKCPEHGLLHHHMIVEQ